MPQTQPLKQREWFSYLNVTKQYATHYKQLSFLIDQANSKAATEHLPFDLQDDNWAVVLELRPQFDSKVQL